MAGSIKGIIVEIGGDTSGLQNALKKVNSATASLSKELRGINSLLKLDPKNTTLLAQKQTVLKENIVQTTEKLKALEEAQKSFLDSGGDLNTAEYRSLQREIEATRQKLSALKAENSSWTKMGNSLVEFGTNLTNISSKIENVGNNITQKLTLPILALSSAIGTAMINSAIEFESAWTGVTKTVDGTEEQMEKLKQGIKDMAEELPSSTTEISAVAEAAGQLGIETDNVLEFTKTMIDMGNATNLSADEAATTLARFANVTKMSQSDFGRLGSVIVALGNNFATTEAEIAQMGMNLASAGTQVGMSQSQIMALATALSSVGLEAQAGGTAFSKVMVNMQLAVEKGGDSLKDFASVAGMTTKEFKEKFQNDATGAIMAFVDGLSKSGERGKSAIKVLDDMGITETRLRDALLRSANASEVMNKAIKLGNEAWTKNTALSDEANKRYQTLASKVQMTKNKLINLATNMGNKLTPTISKMLDKVDDLIDKFDDLTDEEILNIVKTVAMVAAIGPAVTAIGKLGTTTGTVITTIGNFSKAIGNVKNGITVAEGQVGTFTTILSQMLSPVGLATTAIVALTAVTAIYAEKQAEEIYGLNGVSEAVDKQNESWNKLQKSREEQLESSAIEISRLESLKKELSEITDENGKVKAGYEDRAKVILNELNNALGTEYKLNENIIDSYQDVQNEIDNLIKKKKAEALLTAYADEYAEAMKEQAKAVENLVDLKNQLKEKSSELVNATGKERAELELSISAISKKIQEESEQISQYGYTVQNYEKLQEASVSGSVEALEDAVNQMGVSWDRAKTNASESLEDQIQSQEDYVTSLKQSLKDVETAHDDSQAYIIKKQLEYSENRLKNLKGELSTTTTILDTNTTVQNAFDNLGTRSYKLYDGEIKKLTPLTQNEIGSVANTVNTDTSVQNSTGMMAERVTSEFANNNKMSQKMQEEVSAIANVEKNDTSVGSGAARLANEASTNFNNNVNGHKWGSDLVENIVTGLSGSSALGKIAGAAAKVAGIIASYLHHSVPDEGPLTDELKYMPDMIDNLSKTMLEASPKLEKATKDVSSIIANNLSLSSLENGINAKVIDGTKTIFTTPQIVFNVQELDENKLQQCFNYVNRKFGSQY